MKKNILLPLILLLCCNHLLAQDRPNILWLVTEDMSPYLSSYGNKLITTPNLDKLANNGIRYTNAYSNGAQCSPARSTIISGMYAVTTGTDLHRGKRLTNDAFFFPQYLRKAGYYCTNNAKEDYNAKTPDNVWDQSNKKAEYSNRPDKSKPFFAVYNFGGTHMTRVATRTVKGRGKRDVSMKDVVVPGYIPDLPEVRDDISWNMGAVKNLDNWVGGQLQKLKDNGEEENTIIFFYGDHGGTVPRGKAYVYTTGTRIPFVVYLPKKWKHLAGTNLPQVSSRLVSFVDLAPTMLNLAGVEVPSFMVGKPFLTNAANKKENIRESVFCFTANQGQTFKPSRAITDGKYHLIWNFQSGYPNGTRQDYQWQMPAQMAWDKAWITGGLKKEVHKKFWQPVTQLELYDIKKDSLEVNDLANDKKYERELARLKEMLKQEMYMRMDIGLLPRDYRDKLEKEYGPLYKWAQQNKSLVKEIIDAAMIASERKISNLDKLVQFLSNKNIAVQYWGASGINGLAKTGQIKTFPIAAKNVFKDDNVDTEVRNMLAESLVYKESSKEALNFLVSNINTTFSTVANLQNLGALAKPVANDIKELLFSDKAKAKFYLTSILINCDVLPYDDLYKYTGREVGE